MPHLLIERLRTVPFVFKESCVGVSSGRGSSSSQERLRTKFPACALVVELADILGGVLFVLGSACFFPTWAEDIRVLKIGCELFIAGSVIYALVSLYALLEAAQVSGFCGLESFENLLYVFGSTAFLAGTVLFWPGGLEAPDATANLLEQPPAAWQVIVLLNTSSPEFEGSVLCIVGCLFFALAAFVNGLNIRHFNDFSSQLLSAVTSIYMCGSLLFVMGSVAFLPGFGCSSEMVAFGAWLYVIGSMLYLGGSIISLIRTLREIHSPEWHPDLQESPMMRLWRGAEEPQRSYGAPRCHSK